MIHIGKKIEDVLKAQHMPISEFAKKINRSRSVIYHIFERDSIDSHLLYTISKVLDFNFFALYSKAEDGSSALKESTSIYGDGYKQKYFDLLEKHQALLEAKVKEYFLEK